MQVINYTARDALMAQLQFVSEYAGRVANDGGYTDSDYDYLGLALDLAVALLVDDYDGTAQASELAAKVGGYVGASAPPPVAAYLGAQE